MGGRVLLLAVAAGLALSGCFAEPELPAADAPQTVSVSSIAFLDGEPVPRRYTCQAENVSPPLSFGDLPNGTAAIALLMDDPDASVGTITHWTFWDLPPDVRSLPEDANITARGATEGATNARGDPGPPRIGYRGPCPPAGDEPHRYRFQVFALDAPLGLPRGASVDELAAELETHTLAKGILTGTYSRG